MKIKWGKSVKPSESAKVLFLAELANMKKMFLNFNSQFTWPKMSTINPIYNISTVYSTLGLFHPLWKKKTFLLLEIIKKKSHLKKRIKNVNGIGEVYSRAKQIVGVKNGSTFWNWDKCF